MGPGVHSAGRLGAGDQACRRL